MIQASTEDEFVAELRLDPQALQALADDGDGSSFGRSRVREEIAWRAQTKVEEDIERLTAELLPLWVECKYRKTVSRLAREGAMPNEPIDVSIEPPDSEIHLFRERWREKNRSLDLWALGSREQEDKILRALWQVAGRNWLLKLRREVWRCRAEVEEMQAELQGSGASGPAQALEVATSQIGVFEVWWSRPYRAIVAVADHPDHDPSLGNELVPCESGGWQILRVSRGDLRRLREGRLEVPDSFGVNWERVS